VQGLCRLLDLQIDPLMRQYTEDRLRLGQQKRKADEIAGLLEPPQLEESHGAKPRKTKKLKLEHKAS
jgi:hypothetical protein